MADKRKANSKEFFSKKAVIKVVGVGGCGGNALNHMIDKGIKDVDFVAMNSDAAALRINDAPYKVQLGDEGLGVGGNPEKGAELAAQCKEIIKQNLQGTDLLFITAGMGGGTGTGAAPIVAQAAREANGDRLLIVAVVTMPYVQEGKTKKDIADAGLARLQDQVDCVLVVSNERLLKITDKNTSMTEGYAIADNVLLQMVKGISDVITSHDRMNIDFNDIRKIMRNSGVAMVGIGEASGPNKQKRAIREAIESPILGNICLRGAKGLIIHVLSRDPMLHDISDITQYAARHASLDVEIKQGIGIDESLGDKIRVTVIASGFRPSSNTYSVNRDPQKIDFSIPSFIRRGLKHGS